MKFSRFFAKSPQMEVIESREETVDIETSSPKSDSDIQKSNIVDAEIVSVSEQDPEKALSAENDFHLPDILKYGVDEVIDESADNSPLPEVRAVVPPNDDPSLPVNTFRAWFLGIILTVIGSGVNQFFSMRYPGVTITSLVCQLVGYPLGQGLAYILPMIDINLGKLGTYSLNPDRVFNRKEHVLITIMANISFTSSWATDVIQARSAFYGINTPAGLQILMVLTCQLFGFGIAGICDDFLVKPSQMYWPSTLANVALFESIHTKENLVANGWKMTRIRFFLIVFTCSFVWYWFPGFIFTALSYFTWICWIAPNHIVVNQLFGQIQGLGFSPITFDWAQIAYNGSPLITPLSAQVNGIIGWFIFFAILPPILYYKNFFYSKYLPMSSSTVYDNMGNEYNGTRVINALGDLDVEAYKNYSPPFLPVTYAIAYGTSYAILTAGPVYVYLNYGTQVWQALKGTSKKDIHVRLMENYPNVPKWWYYLITIIVWVVTIITMECYHIGWPVWAICMALGMVIVFILPIGMVYAATNINTNSMTVLGQIISGFLLPGKPIVALTFKFYAYTGISQAMAFSQDMKLAYYMKLPKKTTFWAQLVSCIVGAFVQVGVLIFMLGNVKDICTTDQSDGFSCPQGRTNFAASVVWGLVGPKRLVAVGKIYSGFLHLFWLGALLPIITYYLGKKYPNKKWLKECNWVVIFGALGNYPPATGINYTSAFVVAFIFNYYIRKRYGQWWSKYLYVLSCAMDVGVALAGIIIFFCVSYPGAKLNWWGNSVYNDTADGRSTPYYSLPEKGYFGPDTWE